MKKLLLTFASLVLSVNTFAVYNANIISEVTDVMIYTDAAYIYVKVKEMPDHSVCKNGYFVISEDVPMDIKQMLLSRLLMAKATGERLNIGYDRTGDCVHGYMRLHRAG